MDVIKKIQQMWMYELKRVQSVFTCGKINIVFVDGVGPTFARVYEPYKAGACDNL